MNTFIPLIKDHQLQNMKGLRTNLILQIKMYTLTKKHYSTDFCIHLHVIKTIFVLSQTENIFDSPCSIHHPHNYISDNFHFIWIQFRQKKIFIVQDKCWKAYKCVSVTLLQEMFCLIKILVNVSFYVVIVYKEMRFVLGNIFSNQHW